MGTRKGHHPPRKDTTACHLREVTTRITIRKETIHETIGGMVALPRGVD